MFCICCIDEVTQRKGGKIWGYPDKMAANIDGDLILATYELFKGNVYNITIIDPFTHWEMTE